MIRILVVDDSSVVRELLTFLLNSDPELEVIRAVSNGYEALDAIEELRPDVVTMDIHMPGINGYDTTRKIMENFPTPIIIVSGSGDPKEMEKSFHAIEAGALMAVNRPPGLGHPGFEMAAMQLIRSVKAMAEVKVIKRWPRERLVQSLARTPERAPRNATRRIDMVAVGASTGGPVALQNFLLALPKEFSVPIVIVQHMAPGFIHGFAEWLSNSCERPVLVPAHGTTTMPGHVYVAPDGHHMAVDKMGRILLTRCLPNNGLCPSVSHLFKGIAETYGEHAAGVIMTGMGRDGSVELKLMRDAGAITFAQDEKSSVIHGMPGEAIKLGAAEHVMPVEQIASTLTAIVASNAEGHH